MMIVYIYDHSKDMSKKTYNSYLLPSGFDEMDSFVIKNKILMTEQVLDSIDHALKKKLDFVEIFKFTNSDFVITLSVDKFKENIENIYNYYINTENYELCSRVKKLEKKLSKTINSNEKK